MVREGVLTLEPVAGPRVVHPEGVARIVLLDSSEGLEAFHSEADWPQDAPVRTPHATHPLSILSRPAALPLPTLVDGQPSPRSWVGILFVAVALAEAPFVAMWMLDRRAVTPNTEVMGDVSTPGNAAVAPDTGTVYVESEPSGAEVWVNGEVAGYTPTRLSMPRGAAEIQLLHEGGVRVLPLTVVPEEVMRLRVELPLTTGESAELPGSTADSPTNVVGAAVEVSAPLILVQQIPLP